MLFKLVNSFTTNYILFRRRRNKNPYFILKKSIEFSSHNMLPVRVFVGLSKTSRFNEVRSIRW
jgi:hypothetical protein